MKIILQVQFVCNVDAHSQECQLELGSAMVVLISSWNPGRAASWNLEPLHYSSVLFYTKRDHGKGRKRDTVGDKGSWIRAESPQNIAALHEARASMES